MVRTAVGSRLLQLGAVAFGVAAWSLATSAAASYRIESLYSNLAGWFQYIELRENSTDGRITPFAGSMITVKQGAVVKQSNGVVQMPVRAPAHRPRCVRVLKYI